MELEKERAELRAEVAAARDTNPNPNPYPSPNPNPSPNPSPNPYPNQVSAARDREAALEAKQAELQREAEAARSVAALKETQGELIHELDKLRAGEM